MTKRIVLVGPLLPMLVCLYGCPPRISTHPAELVGVWKFMVDDKEQWLELLGDGTTNVLDISDYSFIGTLTWKYERDHITIRQEFEDNIWYYFGFLDSNSNLSGVWATTSGPGVDRSGEWRAVKQ